MVWECDQERSRNRRFDKVRCAERQTPCPQPFLTLLFALLSSSETSTSLTMASDSSSCLDGPHFCSGCNVSRIGLQEAREAWDNTVSILGGRTDLTDDYRDGLLYSVHLVIRTLVPMTVLPPLDIVRDPSDVEIMQAALTVACVLEHTCGAPNANWERFILGIIPAFDVSPRYVLRCFLGPDVDISRIPRTFDEICAQFAGLDELSLLSQVYFCHAFFCGFPSPVFDDDSLSDFVRELSDTEKN